MSHWAAYITDTMTGMVLSRVDMPAFSWTITVSDASLATLKQKGTGSGTVSGVQLPWSALDATTPAARDELLTPDRRAIVLCATNGDDLGMPILWGAIGQRTDTHTDTAFALSSVMTMLQDRYLIREGKYGTGPHGTSTDTITINGSLRGIASQIGWLCTNGKPGGQLPIDWHYRGEPGQHTRTYDAWDVQNLQCSTLLTNISNVIGGPDLGFRPRWDDAHIRLDFVAGSDTDPHIGQSIVHRLTWSPWGGTIGDLSIDHLGAVHRVYASGSGTDKSQLCHLSQDLHMIDSRDAPYPLREAVYSDSDTDKLDLLTQHADGVLHANGKPLMQVKCTMDTGTTVDGAQTSPLGSIWPGDAVELSVRGHAALPDGIYTCRLMEISGDHTTKINLIFDPQPDPII